MEVLLFIKLEMTDVQEEVRNLPNMQEHYIQIMWSGKVKCWKQL